MIAAGKAKEEIADMAIKVRRVSFSYDGKVEVLKDVSFRVGRGKFAAIMGPNGSGKSTLVKILIGLLKPTSGRVEVMGMDPSKDPMSVQRMVGYMPQRDSISKNLPVKVSEVVLLGRMSRKGPFSVKTPSDIREAKRALEYVGVPELFNRPFSALSGGQQQKVLLARALAVDPQILILDEPFSAMDVPSKDSIVDILNDLKEERGMTIVTVVHDVNPILHHLDLLMLLNHRLIAFGPPIEVLTSGNLLETYGAPVRTVTCESGYCHPILGDTHA
ncbi:MAG: metal ABC transporter ATP-binding protein [Thermoplasmata archaeon]|nr:MAG: metal ABC transporter ATP-binding protein [Thermoplasmata archaeon]RLF73078.1 MAG: metal ABC transporter ATP-binding protein [Thermoplasmata archaeon]RLF73375.1 MAG: metal ABC transporter ATP-binding protein [Thermoplasmata archaeon]HDD59446.1 metal ABC transporter ATP-binding protein [Euryarchaeota archaeon]